MPAPQSIESPPGSYVSLNKTHTMASRIRFLITLFVAWLPAFAIQKPLFMLYNRALSEGCSAGDWLQVILHGLKLDCTVAGYLTVLPLVLTLVSVWLPGTWLRRFMKWYFAVVASVIALAFTVDMSLYPYWGFPLDSTVLFYLQSPKDAAASITPASYLLLLIIPAFGYAIWRYLCAAVLHAVPTGMPSRKIPTLLEIILLGCLMFIPIHGGLTTSTANVGMVYFSRNQFLNHSAINPCFSFLASLSKSHDFASQFDFFEEPKRAEVFDGLFQRVDTCPAGSHKQVLATKRPDILIILLESFSANVVEALGGEPGVTPNLSRLCREGKLFSNAYASSFRTDRGLVAVLNGYPGQPTTSVMKYPAKSQTLPSVARTLANAGYMCDVLYGGNIDFTNMHSYFFGSGYSSIVSDKDFPISDRLSKWGANDDVTFSRLYELVSHRDSSQEPWMTTFLTLSSHEPFDVPFHKLEDPYLNSVAFTDSCLGMFIDKVRELPVWDNLLVVLVADHGYRYPSGVKDYEPLRFRIPMLWTGGAVKEPEVVEAICSQTDLAATLLGQMDLPHTEFRFSKDVFCPCGDEFCFYSFINGFGFIDSSGYTVYDNEGNRILVESEPGNASALREEKGKALLQTLYDDLGSR